MKTNRSTLKQFAAQTNRLREIKARDGYLKAILDQTPSLHYFVFWEEEKTLVILKNFFVSEGVYLVITKKMFIAVSVPHAHHNAFPV